MITSTREKCNRRSITSIPADRKATLQSPNDLLSPKANVDLLKSLLCVDKYMSKVTSK